MTNRRKARGFSQIFMDSSDYNEKTIIGFISFSIMVVTAIMDLAASWIDMPFSVNENIYSSFVTITLGSFGVAGLERFSPAAKVEAEAEAEMTRQSIQTPRAQDTLPEPTTEPPKTE